MEPIDKDPASLWYIVNVEAVIVKENRYLMITRSLTESHAPGILTLPGGKVEDAGQTDHILEQTLRREIQEEVGLEVANEIEYLESKAFVTDKGEQVIDLVFLCRYKAGSPHIIAPDEVVAIAWMTAQDVLENPKTPPWTRQSIEMAEKKRLLEA